MTKKFYSFWNLLLGSFIAMLGFGSCKTTKKVQQGDGAVVLYSAPPVKVERMNSRQEIRLLYAVPPVRIEKMEDKGIRE